MVAIVFSSRPVSCAVPPGGGTHYTSGATPTSYQYTGQRKDATGLYFYHARYYDPALGRFLAADSIVPSPGNPQSLNRYSYTLNNPLRYTDPSGHDPIPGVDWLMGVGYQLTNDLLWGVPDMVHSLVQGNTWDLRTSPEYQEGRQVRRNMSQAIGTTMTAHGAATVVAGVSAMGPTAGGSLAAALPTGGTSLVAGGVGLTAEGAMVVGGTAETVYGAGIIAYASKHPIQGSPRSSHMFGENGTQFTSKSLWEGNEGMLHAENPNPGQRPGQIHFQEYGTNGHKWYYDPTANSFLPERGSSLRPPRWLNGLLDDKDFNSAINKGLKYLGE